MKRTKIFAAISVISLAVPFAAPAQESAKGQVVLPDVTTTVEGDQVNVADEANPDFSNLNPQSLDAKEVLPELPDSNSSSVGDELSSPGKGGAEKEVYAEGHLGGGFPGFFTGAFQLYKDSLSNPFTLNFSHLTNNGYGLKTASQGYFTNSTNFDGKKQISGKNMDINIQGAFSSSDIGLQQKSDAFYDISNQTISTFDTVEWSFPLGFGLFLSNDLIWYSRYSGIKDEGLSYIPQEAEASTIYESPYLRATWSNSTVSLGLGGGYNFQHLFTSANDPSCLLSIHRGTFGGDFAWNNDIVGIDAAFNFVVGNTIGSNANFLVPFHLAFSGQWPVSYASVPLRFTVEGGLKSELYLFSQLEKDYSYAKMYELATDQSDWYGQLSAEIPVAQIFTMDAKVLFMQTAFGNGVWSADYSAANANNVYEFTQTERTLLDTELSGTFAWSMFDISVDWKSHWFYVPSNDYQLSVGAALDVNPDSGLWGAKIEVREAFAANSQDLLPFVNLSAYCRMTKSMRIALELNDVIKLVTGGQRYYYGSEYNISAGSAALLLKFYF